MSIHIQLSPEAVQKLRTQRRNSTISSIVISLLALGFVALCLAIWLLPVFNREEPEVIAYSAQMSESEEVDPEKVTTRVTKPTAPSSHQAKVIASTASSPVSIPVPDFEVSEPSMDFGESMDLGEGWGSAGTTGSEASFFNQKVSAERVVWVIDYSESMKGEPDKLMRKELAKSVAAITHGLDFQVIFFSGPAWLAGDKLENTRKGDSGESLVITEKSDKFKWTGKTPFSWKQSGKLRNVPWVKADTTTIDATVNAIKKTPLVWGTDWETPLEMAFAMEPPPQVIFFMTDGGIKDRDMGRLVRGLAAKAKSKNIVVNTVAMMVPLAEEPMKDLAKRTGGAFSIIEKGGKIRDGSN